MPTLEWIGKDKVINHHHRGLSPYIVKRIFLKYAEVKPVTLIF